MTNEIVQYRFNEKQYQINFIPKKINDIQTLSGELLLFTFLKQNKNSEKSIRKHNLGELARIISKK